MQQCKERFKFQMYIWTTLINGKRAFRFVYKENVMGLEFLIILGKNKKYFTLTDCLVLINSA